MAIKRGRVIIQLSAGTVFRKDELERPDRGGARSFEDRRDRDIIDEATIRDYPFPSEQFIYDWNNFMARYDMAGGNDGHLSGCASVPGSYHDSSGSGGTFENDIKLAAKLGFKMYVLFVLFRST